MAKHLYTAKEVAVVRERLLIAQKGIDPITKMKIPKGKAVLDHCHDSQYVRGVLSSPSNVALGKIENLWARYLGWWYTGTLSEFLVGCAEYLEREQPREYLHPKFMDKLQTRFNTLKEGDKKDVLASLGQEEGSNGAERKKLFRKALLKKEKSYLEVLDMLNKLTKE